MPTLLASGFGPFPGAPENASWDAVESCSVKERIKDMRITLGAYAYRYYNVPVEHPSRPRVEAWYERLCARPAYREHVMIPFGSTPEEFEAREREER